MRIIHGMQDDFVPFKTTIDLVLCQNSALLK